MHIAVSCDAMKAGKIVAMEAGGANSEEDCWKLVRTYEETFGVDTEYLLGEDLLVAPAFLGENEREIYLPEGKWRDYFTGEIVESGRRTVATNKIAVFEKII